MVVCGDGFARRKRESNRFRFRVREAVGARRSPEPESVRMMTPSPPTTDGNAEGDFRWPGCLEAFLAIDGMHSATCGAPLDLRGRKLDGVYSVVTNSSRPVIYSDR